MTVSGREAPTTPGAKIPAASLYLMSALLALPMYIVVTPAGPTFGPLLALEEKLTLPTSGFTIALAGIALVLLAAAATVLKHRRLVWDLPVILALSTVAWMSLAMVYGAYGNPDWRLNALFYVQSVLPFLTFAAVRQLPLTKIQVRRALCIFAVASSLSAALIVGLLAYYAQFYVPIIAWSYVQEAFYSAKNLQPVIVAIGLGVVLASLSVRAPPLTRTKGFFLFLLSATFVFAIWSRTGLAVILGTVAIWSCLQAYRAVKGVPDAPSWPVIGLAGAFVLVGAGVNYWAAGIALRSVEGPSVLHPTPRPPPPVRPAPKPPQLRPGQKPPAPKPLPKPPAPYVPQVTSAEHLHDIQERGDARRWQLMVHAIDRIRQRPIFGDAFTPVPSSEIPIGTGGASLRLFPSHNQFTDLALRAGLPATLFFVGLLCSIAVGLWRNRDATFLGKVRENALILLAMLTMACMTQVYFIVTQPAIAIFMLLALGLRTWPDAEG